MPKKAFTLIEALIYILILTLILTSISTFILRSFEQQALTASEKIIINNAKIIMNEFQIQIEEAQSIDINASQLQTNPGILSLVTANPLTTPTDFQTSQNHLFLYQGSGSGMPLTSNDVTVSSLIFSQKNRPEAPQSIKIQLTLKHGNQTLNFQNTFSIRRR